MHDPEPKRPALAVGYTKAARALLPPPLEPGAKVAVVAPSGPPDPLELDAGLALLRARYELILPRGLEGRCQGFLAGSDEQRAAELQAALDDPEIQAVWVARGGYGLGRIAPHISWLRVAARPRWIVGFSDATVLHAHLAKLGIASLHAANVTSLARLPAEQRSRTFEVLEGAEPDALPVQGDIGDSGWGPVFGGNLTVLFTEAAAGRLAVPAGASLLLEDVSETSYRVDRMLTALRDAGHLDAVSGLLLGEFTDCSPGKFGVSIDEVLRERLSSLGKPIARGLPIGHGAQNAPLVLGIPPRLTVRP